MIKIKLVGPAGAYTNLANMLESGVIFFDGGRISHITTEMSKGQTVYTYKEEVSPEPNLRENKLAPNLKKKPGRKPKNEPGT